MAFLVATQAASWFSDNKKWLVPTLIGLLVLMIVGYIVSSIMSSVTSSRESATETFTDIRRVKSQIDEDRERFENFNARNISNR
jgi:uncharacterized membrane-anchored protein YhcB (DUF1043 family)